MHSITGNKHYLWKMSATAWTFNFAALALLAVIFYPGIKEMVFIWNTREEYSYGYLIPFITLFLVWQKRAIIEKISFTGSWGGIVVILLGLALFVLGSLVAFSLAIQLAMLIVIYGIMLSIMGWQGFKPVFIPVLFLVFMIPMPGFFLFNLSAQLQLISSSLGVGILRLLGISVYLEGNVIDFGSMKLQVVEACSGLRYLFPLMSLAFICAYVFRGAFWKRVIIFLSSIPITIFMNSFRIGVIGVLVEHWGKSQAEGFLHDFEGWVVFMACLGIILVEIWFLARIGKHKLSLSEAFRLDAPPPPDKDAEVRVRKLPTQYMAAGAILIAAAISSHFLATRTEVKPTRAQFTSFPLAFADWRGKQDFLEKIALDFLKLDDYLFVDYFKGSDVVNFYVAYYASQRAGESAHSPRTCIPGGGWEIKNLVRYGVEGIRINGKPLVVNRLLIQKGDDIQLVYYWFQQRGRIITNEYVVKWYLLEDALIRRRSDGALVRLTTPIRPGEDLSEGDRRLTAFAALAVPALRPYIPN